MAVFAGLADALASIGGALGSPDVEAVFCDLAGFGLFKNRYGQAAGDDALRAFAESLAGTGPDRANLRAVIMQVDLQLQRWS